MSKIIDRKILTLEETHRLRGLKMNALQDYLSARVLFLNSMVLQACVMSSQSIEKFLKMILEINGLPVNNGHNLFQLFSFLKKTFPSEREVQLFSKINSEYLTVLTRLYQSRYLGDCKPGFNYVILKNKFLSELDYLFSILYPFITLVSIREPEDINKNDLANGRIFDMDSMTVEPVENGMISQNNFLYSKKSRSEFLNKVESVTEFRITKTFKHVHLTYDMQRSFDDGKYLYNGLEFLETNDKKPLFRKDGTLFA